VGANPPDDTAVLRASRGLYDDVQGEASWGGFELTNQLRRPTSPSATAEATHRTACMRYVQLSSLGRFGPITARDS